MDLQDSMVQAAKGMKAQGVRMRIISENLANSETTGLTKGADPYQRKTVTFKNVLDKTAGVNTVQVDKVIKDKTPFTLKYDPQHPAADKNGYVKTPNVNTMVEMMDMREAQRSYEANLGVIDVSKNMINRTIEMMSR